MKTNLNHSAGIAALLIATAFLSHPGAAPAVETELDAATSAALDAALNGDHRSPENKARDRYRRPKETLAFFGFRSDMTVVKRFKSS